MNDVEMKRIIEAAVDGTATRDEQAELMKILTHSDEGRRYFAMVEKEAEILKKAFQSEIEVPADLKNKVLAAFPKEEAEQLTVVLQVKEPERDERIETFKRSSISIGRGTEVDFRIFDNDVSRLHCKLEYRNNKFNIVDQDSKNGIILNEIKVKECDIEAGDIIRLGSTVIKVVQCTEAGSLTGSCEITNTDELGRAYISAKINGEEKKFPIKKEVVSIGRGTEADIRFDSDNFSRKHCCIERVFDEFQLVDLGSTNGTLLNGAPALMETLHDGDIIKVDDVEMVFKNPAEKKVSADISIAIPLTDITSTSGPEIVKPKIRKIDHAVLEAKRKRLQSTLSEDEEAGDFTKWIIAAAAFLLLAVGIGFAVMNSFKGDNGPGYDTVEASGYMREVRTLKNNSEYEKCVTVGEGYLGLLPADCKEAREINGDVNYCKQQIKNETDAKDRVDIVKAKREFKSFVERMELYKNDPIALDQLFNEFKYWKSTYERSSMILIRDGTPTPDINRAVMKSISDLYDSVKVEAAMLARKNGYGHSVSKLKFFTEMYKDVVSKYSIERWQKYSMDLNEKIAFYLKEGREVFDYNWELAEYYIKERMFSEAIACLMIIINDLGIEEYKKHAEDKLATIEDAKDIGTTPTDKPDKDKVASVERYTEDGSNALVKRYKFAEAIKYLESFKASTDIQDLKKKVDSRIEEIKYLDELFKWYISSLVPGNKIDLGGGMVGTIEKVDATLLIIKTAGGSITYRWESLKPKDLLTYMENSAKKHAFNKALYLNMSVFCLEYIMRKQALDYLCKAYTFDEKLKPALDVLYARYSGKQIPKEGFIVYKGSWYTEEEHKLVLFDEGVDEAIQNLDNKDEKVVKAALDKLEKLIEVNKSAVVERLKLKLSDLRIKIESFDLIKTLKAVQELRIELNKRRKEAKETIFDLDIYPDENHGAIGQPIVDEKVRAVREIYETPIKGVIDSSPELKALVIKARTISEFLFEHDAISEESMYNIEAFLGTLNDKIDINVSMNPTELRNYNYSMKVKEYNLNLKINGRSTKAEKECATHTNNYRLMMGEKFLRIDRMITKAARHHSYQMAKKGFFAHQDPNTGTHPADRMQAAGYSSPGGENIARGPGMSPYGAFNGWYNSSGHHRNMLRSRYTEIGHGFYSDYWTQNFGVGSVNENDEPDNTDPIPECGEDTLDGKGHGYGRNGGVPPRPGKGSEIR